MRKNVIIIGAGGHAKVVADIVRKNDDILVGFLDDAYENEVEFYDSRIFGPISMYTNFKGTCSFIIAIGNNKIREKISNELDCTWYTGIHPTAVVSKSANVGEGTVVMPNAVINADAQIGKHSIVNSGAIVEHDCYIGDYSHIAPKSVVCGVTNLGEKTFLGAGGTIINVVNVCDGVNIGAGAVVIKDIKESGTYVGVPCKKIK